MHPDPRERPITPRSAARTSPSNSAAFDYLKLHDPSRAVPRGAQDRPTPASRRVVWVRPSDLFARAGTYAADRNIAWMVAANRWVHRLFERGLILATHATREARPTTPSRPGRLAPPDAFGAYETQRRTPPSISRTWER